VSFMTEHWFDSEAFAFRKRLVQIVSDALDLLLARCLDFVSKPLH
jgi:hypothetical protein